MTVNIEDDRMYADRIAAAVDTLERAHRSTDFTSGPREKSALEMLATVERALRERTVNLDVNAIAEVAKKLEGWFLAYDANGGDWLGAPPTGYKLREYANTLLIACGFETARAAHDAPKPEPAPSKPEPGANMNWISLVNQVMVARRAFDNAPALTTEQVRALSALADVEAAIKSKFGWDSVTKDSVAKDLVNHPSHYTFGQYEVIDVITDWKLGFDLGNVVKYVARAGRKQGADPLEDLKKARFYLDHQIKLLEGDSK